jgi:hypothetical protein
MVIVSGVAVGTVKKNVLPAPMALWTQILDEGLIKPAAR